MLLLDNWWANTSTIIIPCSVLIRLLFSWDGYLPSYEFAGWPIIWKNILGNSLGHVKRCKALMTFALWEDGKG